MKNKQWRVGDWAFYEFKLVRIMGVKDIRVTCVSEGNGSTSAYDMSDELFEMSLQRKLVSEVYSNKYDQLHTEARGARLNFPEFKAFFVKSWITSMSSLDSPSVLSNEREKIEAFANRIIELVTEQREIKVFDVQVFV